MPLYFAVFYGYVSPLVAKHKGKDTAKLRSDNRGRRIKHGGVQLCAKGGVGYRL